MAGSSTDPDLSASSHRAAGPQLRAVRKLAYIDLVIRRAQLLRPRRYQHNYRAVIRVVNVDSAIAIAEHRLHVDVHHHTFDQHIAVGRQTRASIATGGQQHGTQQELDQAHGTSMPAETCFPSPCWEMARSAG